MRLDLYSNEGEVPVAAVGRFPGKGCTMFVYGYPQYQSKRNGRLPRVFVGSLPAFAPTSDPNTHQCGGRGVLPRQLHCDKFILSSVDSQTASF